MRTFVGLLFVLIVAGGVYYTTFLRADDPPNFRTVLCERGDLLLTISATGTLEPQEVVDVGAQVVGRIEELGLDPRAASDPEYEGKRIDYGSPVEEGTILAKIDEALYRATYNQSIAAVERAKADLIQLKARYAQATAEWERAQRLRNLKLTSVSGLSVRGGRNREPTTVKGISDADFVLAKANYEVAKANVDVGVSAIRQQEATLLSAATNLDYTIIRSPVRGTIIDRRVNIGQTVVSSLNAPSLFLIAKDLRRMEVWASVNEADIGQLTVGMPVHFTVDAYPDDVFRGSVTQIRLNATMTQNVVTYTVVVTTNNDDLKLLPYLTADIDFEVEQRENVLKVPNAALRYRPRAELIAAESSSAAEPQPSAEPDPAAASWVDDLRTVWVRRENQVYPIAVRIGLTDGAFTEIVAGELTEDIELIVAEEVEERPTEANNPFAPRRPRKKKTKDAK